ncbi:ATP-binding protein [Streptomyces sp. WAC 04229]|uniref:ATP-binding protein n=1 Tax=Streptomyces sp. WAC 04229 TaxID=2203206 RepID=UPI003D7581D2
MSIDLTLLSDVAYRGRAVTAPGIRRLLALLSDDVPRGCSTERLIAGLWPDSLPQRPSKAVQILVSRARAQLGSDLVVSTPTGYRLSLQEDQVDGSALLLAAAAGAERLRSGDFTGALAAAEEGLALWDGHADEEDLTDPVAALRARRAPTRAALVRIQGLSLVRLGRPSEAAGPLAVAASEHPRDEEVLAELLRGEASTAGPSAALARYEAYRRELRDDLGTDPGLELRLVQQELLRGQAPGVRRGVPHEPNPLLGRERDVAAVEELLRGSRVVAVVGPGGLGKTRLAYAVSRRAEQRSVYFVSLVGVTADADVSAEVASALGAGERRHGNRAAADPVSGILGVLGSGPALLVLDNCEHVIRGAAGLVQALLASSSDLRVLATGRAPLGLSSEAVYALPVLALATSVELFTQRARAARPDAKVPPDEVAELCRHLDGLPLAVELAAARVRVMAVSEIARRISDRFALLRGGARDAPERHRTLHAVVDWSWNLLSPEAQRALRTLSVFPGGCSGRAAEQVLGEQALLLLEQLVDQSLLAVVEAPSGVRFRMLETIREFGAARRAELDHGDDAVDRFVGWAREFAVEYHTVLFDDVRDGGVGGGAADAGVGAECAQDGGPDASSGMPVAAWQSIRAEQDNLVLALRLALERRDGPSTAALTAVLAALWSTDSNYPRLAALACDTGPQLSHYRPEGVYVEVTRVAAVLCTASLFMGYRPQVTVMRQLVTLRRLPPASPDTLLRATAVVLSAVPDMVAPDYAVLQRLCESRVPMVAGIAECVATYVWEFEHDIDKALASARRMIAALASVANPSIQVMAHARLSDMCLQTEDGDAAYRHLKAALAVLPRLDDEHDSIGIRRGLVLACLQRGDPDEAEYWLRQSDGDRTRQGDASHIPDLGGRAEIALARGLVDEGLGLWRSAVRWMPEAGAGGTAASHGGDPWSDPWALEIQSAAVTAHAHAGRLDMVTGVVERLRRRLLGMLSAPPRTPRELPVYGTVMHALGMAGLAAGDVSAVRLIALAARMRVLREFQPTMSAARAHAAAQQADAAAFATAVSVYGALARDELRDAARDLMQAR